MDVATSELTARETMVIFAKPMRDEIIAWACLALRNSEISYIDEAVIEDFADGLRALQAPERAGGKLSETTLSVSKAALLVADAIESDMTSFNAMLMAAGGTFSPDTPVRHYFATILREFAKLKKAGGDPNG